MLTATFEIGRGSYHQRVCLGSAEARRQERHPGSPQPRGCHRLSSPLLLAGGPPRPVPRGSRALERLVPLQAPRHGQLLGSGGKGVSRGMQRPALPLQRQCPPALRQSYDAQDCLWPCSSLLSEPSCPGSLRLLLARRRHWHRGCEHHRLLPVCRARLSPLKSPTPMVQGFTCQNCCCSWLPLLLARRGRRGWPGFSSIFSLWAKQLYRHNLLVRWKWEIIHPAAFNSS